MLTSLIKISENASVGVAKLLPLASRCYCACYCFHYFHLLMLINHLVRKFVCLLNVLIKPVNNKSSANSTLQLHQLMNTVKSTSAAAGLGPYA